MEHLESKYGNRSVLLKQLYNYHPNNNHEQILLPTFIDFIECQPNCFERSCLTGHITAGAFVVKKVDTVIYLALLRSVKAIEEEQQNTWWQPGGHCDGNPDTVAVASKEAFEELGLGGDLTLEVQGVFDIEKYEVPEKVKNGLLIPKHLHYDIRYLFSTTSDTLLIADPLEAVQAEWINIEAITDFTDDHDTIRAVGKIRQRFLT